MDTVAEISVLIVSIGLLLVCFAGVHRPIMFFIGGVTAPAVEGIIKTHAGIQLR